MKQYESLFMQYKDQAPDTVFSHFYLPRKPDGTPDYDAPFRDIAKRTIDGADNWGFHQPRFKAKYPTEFPKLRNYLNYTFVRLQTLEAECPGDYFLTAQNGDWICFNTGLHNQYGVDLVAGFQRYRPKPGAQPGDVRPDWVYKFCSATNDGAYRNIFGNKVPKIAWYSKDSRDFVFDTSYNLDKDAFDHHFERAKERAGLPNATDEVVRNYLRGAIENLIPKILRNYKIAIPVYYVEEKRMQLLLPFVSASNSNDVSCFLVERDDANKSYHLKTIFDLDHAYFSARLITRPDREWLDP
jgi:hypothetical protein